MPQFLGRILSPREIESLEREVIEEGQAERREAAWRKLQPLQNARHRQIEAASCLLRVIDRACLPGEGAVDVLSEIAQSHYHDVSILAAVGECVEAHYPSYLR